MGVTAVIPGQIVGVGAKTLLGNNTAAEAACGTVSWAAASTGHVLAVQGDGTVAFQAPAGITSLNALTDATQTFATGTSGTDVAFVSATGVHTLNIPSASATARGVVTTGTQTIAGAKTFSSQITATLGVDIGAFQWLRFSGAAAFTMDGNDVRMNNAALQNVSEVRFAIGGSPYNARITGDAANIIAQRNATNAQVFRVYNSYTSDTSLERVSLGWSSNVCTLATEAGSAGGTQRNLQVQSLLIPPNYTASPNATVNHLSMQATGSTTNVSVSIVPKGSGAFSLQVPDGTTTGGNVRGANAVDLQTVRSAANQVAEGPSSFVAGLNCRAVGSGAVAIGNGALALNAGYVIGSGCSNSGYSSLVGGAFSSGIGNEGSIGFGRQVESNANYVAVFNYQCNGTGIASFVTGSRARGRLEGERAHASGAFASSIGQGDCQKVENILRGTTTTNQPVELLLGINRDQRFVIPAGFIWHGFVIVTGTKSDGSAVAVYIRQLSIKRVANTTSLVGSVVTIGTDQAAGTSLSITADDTNESAKVEPTGVLNETWRWQAIFDGGLIAYGT